MIPSMISSLLFLAASAVASPMLTSKSLASRDFAPLTPNITIHHSCNATERRQLTKAIADTVEMATVARDYVLNNGPTDPVYKTYFGSGDWISVIGAYEGLIHGNKQGVVFRCDDIDGNCPQEGWAGHWRGTNATLETVICPLSYEVRKPIEQVCALGYTVAKSSASYFFATDLIHRLFHVPSISNSKVSHYADTYEQCLELAVKDAAKAPYNTHTLQYFAADAYARVVANPGVGCTGEFEHTHGETPAPTPESSAAPAPTSVTPPASTPATPVTEAPSSCHTHADGEVHC